MDQDGRPVTIRDLARYAGVSVTTVSYVLNKRGSVSPDVRKRVFDAAEHLGYRQNRAARTMKTGRSEIIGLIIPNLENPFFATLSQVALLRAQELGYQVFLIGTEGSLERQSRALQDLVQQGVDGIVIFPVNELVAIPDRHSGVPVVVIDRRVPKVDLVEAEYYDGGCQIATHLLNLGHRTFGLLDGPADVSSSRDRVQGFVDSIKGEGEILWRATHPYMWTLNKAAQALLKKNKATAIVCGNDLIAIGTVSALQKMNVDIPGDVSVVGFDDIALASLMTPSLTTVQMPTQEMGRAAIDRILQKIGSPEDGPRPPQTLPVKIVPRASTGPARTAKF